MGRVKTPLARQPPLGTPLNLSHPAIRNPLLCEFGGVPADVVKPQVGAKNTPASEAGTVGFSGKQATFTGNTLAGHLYTGRSTAALTEFTSFGIFTWTSGAANNFPQLCGTSTGNTGFRVGMGDAGGGNISLTKGGAVQLAALAVTSGVPYAYFVSHKQSTGDYYFLLKNLQTQAITVATQTETSVSSAGSGTYGVGIARTDFNGAWNGSIAMCYMGAAFVPQAIARAWLQNPWGVFRPAQKQSALGIAFDAASNSGYQAASSAYSWSHTCSGLDRYLTVGVSMLSVAQTVTGITYNGVAMTALGSLNSSAGAVRVEMWGLITPATGANTIAVTLSGAIASAGNASSYNRVHQTSPTEGWASAQATNVGAADATVNVTTTADRDFVVDIVATDDAAITVGAGQTQTGNVTGAGGSGAMSYEGPKTPAGSVTMSWTDVGALATWVIGGVALRPTTASTLGGGFFARWYYELIGKHTNV